MSYCADCADPTGFMSSEQAAGLLRKLGIAPKTISELVTLGAWEVCEDGYLLHDFEHYVPPRSTERVRAFRKRKRNADETLSTGNGLPVPAPVPEPVPVTDVPPVIPLTENAPAVYGVPKTNMHVERFHTLSETLGKLRIQSQPVEEAI